MVPPLCFLQLLAVLLQQTWCAKLLHFHENTLHKRIHMIQLESKQSLPANKPRVLCFLTAFLPSTHKHEPKPENDS